MIMRMFGLRLLLMALLTVLTTQGFAQTIWNVPAGGDLQAAITAAQPGDTIVVAAGAVFTGPFNLTAKAGAGWITIRTSASDAALGGVGARVSPGQASLMPTLVSPGFNQPVVQTVGAANHYQLIGLELCPASPQAFVSTLAKLGDGAQNQLGLLAHDLILDRCYLHGLHGVDLKRGVELNSASTQILNCYISDCKGVNYDTQAICGWNGPGPFIIRNNYLEGAGENLMFGGADPAIAGLIPSDILIQNNYFSKPLSWRAGDASYGGIHYSIKNLLEIKNAQRVTIDNNLFENCWVDAQIGFAISLKSASQSAAAPWSTCSDVAFTNNLVRHSACGINIAGNAGNFPSTIAARLSIVNNLFLDIGTPQWGGDGIFLQVTDADSLTVNHNTIFQTGNILSPYGAPVTNMVFTNNIAPHNTYGVKGSGATSGKGTLAKYCPRSTFNRNAVAGNPGSAALYPAGNFWPAAWGNVGFVDFVNGDYRLAAGSPYKNAATDRTDIGCIPGVPPPPPVTYSISGKVTLNGTGLGGATVSAGNSSVTTAADGSYSVIGLVAGTYNVSAAMTGYAFGAAVSVTLGPSAAGINFGGTASPFDYTLTLDSAAVAGGGAGGVGTITFNSPAAPGSFTVQLACSNAATVTIPANAIVNAGTTTVSFPIHAAFVVLNTQVTITATWNGSTKAVALTVVPLLNYLNTATSVLAGQTSNAMVFLNGPAPAGGVVVKVSSSSRAATVPATVTVPAGKLSIGFKVKSTSVKRNTTVNIKATLAGVSSSSAILIKARH